VASTVALPDGRASDTPSDLRYPLANPHFLLIFEPLVGFYWVIIGTRFRPRPFDIPVQLAKNCRKTWNFL